MKQAAESSKAIAKPLTDEEIWAKICLTGNLAGLSDEKRLLYYEKYCAYLGLDPITRPFDLITTYDTDPITGARIEKTVLYANAGCSAQLAEKRHITYGKPETVYDSEVGTITISVQAITQDGTRACWRRGVAHVTGLKGRWLENAIKKSETQAHRRATLALCGVAMADESEIEDIEGAQVSAIVPTASDTEQDIDEMIGIYLKAARIEDSEIERKFVVEGLRSGAFQAVAQRLKVPVDVVLSMNKRRLRKLDLGKLDAVTDDVKEAIAEELQAAHEKLAEAARVEGEIKAEAEAEREAEKKRQAEEIASAQNPIPGLVVTLSETHQKVSDTVMAMIKDYKRDKADILQWVGKFMGRAITKSADLDEAEAARVLKWLNAWITKLKKAPKASPPMEFCQIYRNHGDEVGERLDFVYQRLTTFSVQGQAILNKMQEILVRTGAPVVNTRYALDDDAAVAVCEIFEDWANDLAQNFTP